MKRTYRLLLLLSACMLLGAYMLTGCAGEREKLCRIEIHKGDSTDVILLEQQSQADTAAFFDEDQWTECELSDENLVPEYRIELYQESTPSVVRRQKEDSYEKITEYTTYEDSDIVKVTISGELIKNIQISEEYLTLYYRGSEDFFTALKHAAE